jgi:hypothetical protein
MLSPTAVMMMTMIFIYVQRDTSKRAPKTPEGYGDVLSFGIIYKVLPIERGQNHKGKMTLSHK